MARQRIAKPADPTEPDVAPVTEESVVVEDAGAKLYRDNAGSQRSRLLSEGAENFATVALEAQKTIAAEDAALPAVPAVEEGV